MSDLFSSYVPALDSPASRAFAITPNDSADLAIATRWIAFTTAGDLKVDTVGGDTVTIPNGMLAANVLHPLRVARVYNTGTTASGLWGFA